MVNGKGVGHLQLTELNLQLTLQNLNQKDLFRMIAGNGANILQMP